MNNYWGKKFLKYRRKICCVWSSNLVCILLVVSIKLIHPLIFQSIRRRDARTMSKKMRTRKDLLSSRRRRPTYVRVRINPISSRNIFRCLCISKNQWTLFNFWVHSGIRSGGQPYDQTSAKPYPLLQSGWNKKGKLHWKKRYMTSLLLWFFYWFFTNDVQISIHLII